MAFFAYEPDVAWVCHEFGVCAYWLDVVRMQFHQRERLSAHEASACLPFVDVWLDAVDSSAVVPSCLVVFVAAFHSSSCDVDSDESEFDFHTATSFPLLM